MCGIAGIVSSRYRELGPLLEEMLRSMQHRGPDGAGFVIGDDCERKKGLDELAFKGKKGNTALGHVRLAITGESTGLQPFRSEDRRLSLLHNGEIYNYRELSGEIDSNRLLTTGSDSEVLLRIIEKDYRGNLGQAVEKILPKLDGVYTLAITDQDQMVVARDKIGVRQLYYYAKNGLVAFASEKKPLLALGGGGIKIHRLPPGHMMIMRKKERDIKPFWSPNRITTKRRIRNSKKAIESYDHVIREAVRKRVKGKDRVGIIFSGGVDSFLIAYLVKRFGVSCRCYVAGKKDGAADLDWALRAGSEYGFPTMANALSVKDIRQLIPHVIRDIEDHSLNQVEVAIPIYAAVQMAQEAGERVILTGQGADELFGGYPWYPTIVDRDGYDTFVQRSWEDTFLLYKECLEREDKIAMAHSLELRVPFLDPEVIRIAFSIAPELKIKKGGDSKAKRIHREYCQSIGIPDEIAYRDKEAAQHGANIHNALEEIAGNHGLTAKLMKKVGYDPDRTVTEKLGSSSRYGFRYGQQHLWKPLPHVQFYLDSVAARLRLLSPSACLYWELIQRKLSVYGIPSIEVEEK